MKPHPLLFLMLALALSSCSPNVDSSGAFTEVTPVTLQQALIPMPVSLTPGEGNPFVITAETGIYVEGDSEEVLCIAGFLADVLRPSTGYPVPVERLAGEAPAGAIVLRTGLNDATLGAEGYQLTVAETGVTLAANEPAGLFRGIQTIRQLLPPAVEQPTVQDAEWAIAPVQITDYPRYEWRGAMLDVARHFHGVDRIKRYIDLLAYHKMNRLHLHLSDDQGWRIEIKSWPKLTEIGGATAVDGDPGGFFTQEEYADFARYAAERYVTIVPEIDMPGHTNAALSSYAELNCDGVATEPYTGIEVGFSSLCVDAEITYRFVDDVVREIAAITPGPYFHIGGDEVETLTQEQYNGFVERVQDIVQSHGKIAVGWDEIAHARLLPTTLVQHWASDSAAAAIRQGARLIMSPATHAYVDMKYDDSTPLGLNWAGNTSVEDGYSWDPIDLLPGVTDENVAGVEAPLWTETIKTMEDIEFMAFPRMAGNAEIGWSPREGRSWAEYQHRLALHGARLSALGVNFYRAPEISWLP